MGNSCNQCGNKLPQGAKFCTKCGNPVPESEQINAIEKVQETVDKFKESAENVSTVVKEKTKQTVQQSQEFIQSEQFQNAKNEAVKNTKNFIQRFFECNINSQENFTRAEQMRKRCMCVIFAMIAATIFLFSFYDEYCWYNGMWYSIMKFASFLSITSRMLVIPICIIAFIKYSITNKEIKRYKGVNQEVQTHDMRMNKKAMLITLAVCIICVPVVSKINDIAYQNDTYSKSSEQVAKGGNDKEESTNTEKGSTGQNSKDVTLHADNWDGSSLTGQNAKAYKILMSSDDRIEIVNFSILEMVTVLMEKDDNFSIRIEQGVGVTDDNLRFIRITGNCIVPNTYETMYGSVTYKINISEQTCKYWGNNEKIREIWTAYSMGN